jgi:HEAT repeat protein
MTASPSEAGTTHSLPGGGRRKLFMTLATFVGVCFLLLFLFVLSPEVRQGCVKLLGGLGPRGLSAVNWFLDDSNPHVRLAALEVLTDAGPDAVPILVEALSSDQPDYCIPRIQLLHRIGRSAKDAVPKLVEIVEHSRDELVRERAVEALAVVGNDSPLSLQAIMRSLDDSSAAVRGAAAESLGRIGAGAHGSIQELATTLSKEKDAEVRTKIVVALGSIGHSAGSMKALMAALQDPAVDVRAEAAESIGSFGMKAKDAVLPLANGLKDPHPRVRHESAEALGKIGPDARAAIPFLRKALLDADERVAGEARAALDRIGD